MNARRGSLILGITLVCVALACQDTTAPPQDLSPETTAAALRGPPGGGPLSLTVSPASAALYVGGTIELAYAITNPAGRTVNSRRAVSWSTSDPAVAVVSASGVVSAIAPGSATITASVRNGSGSAAILVACPPGTIPVNTSEGVICIGGGGGTPEE